MKLAITQTVLGVLIVLAALYIVGWMIHGVPSLLRMPVPGESGIMSYTDGIPKHEALFNTARYASGLIPVFGLVVLVAGTVQAVQTGKRRTKLIVIQMISGALIATVSILIGGWGYPTQFTIPMPEGSEVLKQVFINPGPVLIRVHGLTFLSFLLGLAVLGVGIAQYWKARR